MDMTTSQAISYLLENHPTYYEVAKLVRDSGLSKMQPTQVKNYHSEGVRMSKDNANTFLFLFGINITDAHEPKGRPRLDWGD